MAQLRTSLLIEAIDRISAPLRKISGAVRRAAGSEGFGKLAEAAGRAGAAVGRLGAKVAAAGGSIAGLALTGMTFGVIKVAAEFERFETILTTIEGSALKAKASMAWVKQFAATTPYQIAEVTDAFVKLKAYGIDPQAGALSALGDMASAMGKTLDQAVEALADAQTGEFERLKDFTIATKQAGDQVTFSYTKNGKAIQVVAKKTAASINAALLGIMNDRFSGAMVAQSKNFDGMMSSLKDAWTDFQLTIAQAGVFDYVKGALADVLKRINAAARDKSLQVWAQRIGDALTTFLNAMVDLATKVDWIQVINQISGAATAIAGFLTAIGGLKGVFDIAVVALIAQVTGGLIGLAPAIALVATAVLGFEVAAAPIIAIILGIGLVVAGVYMAFSRWKQIPNLLKPLVLALMGPIAPLFLIMKYWDQLPGFFTKVWNSAKTSILKATTDIWNSLPTWLKNVLSGTAFVLRTVATGGLNVVAGDRFRPASSGRAQPAVGSRAAAAQVGGRVDVRIDQDGKARVTNVQASNPAVPLSVVRGAAAAHL